MKRLAVASLAFVGFGCAQLDDGPDTSEETSALLNGTSTSARGEVAKFWHPGGGYCTATMISTRTFLTAAHCIEYAPLIVGGTMEFQGSLGTFNVLETFSQGGQTGPDDNAVGRLQTQVSSITPATVSNVQPANQYLTTLGYGCVGGRNTDDCGATDRTYITYFYDGTNTYFHSKGDSGGPTFIGALNNNGEIVRVHSTHDYPDGPDVGADAVTYRTQILSLSNQLNGTGIAYRSQVQSQGWTAATSNGAQSGTTSMSLRLEGLQIWLPENDIYGDSVCYTAYVQDVGWQSEVCNGNLAGTVGLGKRMEAIKIRIISNRLGCGTLWGPPCHVRYNTYLEGIGWQGWVSNNAVSGTTGQSRRIEAIKIELI